MTTSARQGHPYLFHSRKAIALEPGVSPKVLFIDSSEPWLWETQRVDAKHLVPQPMRYLHGETPK